MLVGLDIGGTKIEGVIVSASDSEVLHRIRKPTPKNDYASFFNAVKTVIDELMALQKIKSIGVGCCGSINQATGLINGANILCLNGHDFLADLQNLYSLPVAITNDANCLAISEFKTGAAKEAKKSCLAVIIGTGCGGGLIVNGDVVDGLHGLGGEIGHNPLPSYNSEKDGPIELCYCGSFNCIESFVSGTGFERLWKSKYPKKSAQMIFQAFADGDPKAIEHINTYVDQLARVLGCIVNVIDPEIIVLGGGLSNQDAIYPLLQNELSKFTFSKNVSTQIVKAQHGDSSGVLGAAYLPHFKGFI